MTEQQMFEDVRAQLRSANISPLEALANTISKAGAEIKPFYKGEKHLYVRCDCMPFGSISTVNYLANSNRLGCRIVALTRVFQLDGVNETICSPYIDVYQL